MSDRQGKVVYYRNLAVVYDKNQRLAFAVCEVTNNEDL